MSHYRPAVLSVAGSDSGGGAGIQADIRSISAAGGFATVAVTALTAQNLKEVRSVFGVSLENVMDQVRTVWDGFEIRAVKTGMLWSEEIVNFIAEWAGRNSRVPFVVDPVMLSTSGGKLLKDEAIESYRTRLLPKCYLATPNLDEASFLLGEIISDVASLKDAARSFSEKFGCAVLLKGGHLRGDPIDVLSWDGKIYSWRHSRVEDVETHGSGCSLSALVATELAKGQPLQMACENAIFFLQRMLKRPIALANGVRVLGHEEA